MTKAKANRARFPRSCDYHKTFQKDYERLLRSGRFDLRALKQVMSLLIANDEPLGPEWLDHPLKGEWSGYRECHVGGDFLLIYKVDEDSGKGGAIIFVRTGTHADLFNE